MLPKRFDTTSTAHMRANARRSMRIHSRDTINRVQTSELFAGRTSTTGDHKGPSSYSQPPSPLQARRGFASSPQVPTFFRHVEAPPQSKEQEKPESEHDEDAWLNDRIPANQSRSQEHSKEQTDLETEHHKWDPDEGRQDWKAAQLGFAEGPDAEPQRQSETHISAEQTVLLPQTKNYIGCDSPLWPVLLCLSKRIWQELYQKPDTAPARTSAMMKFVRKRCLSLLRSEPGLTVHVHNLSEAELVLRSVIDEVLGYGPLERLLNDERIREIIVVGPRLTYVEREGRIEEALCHFEDESHIQRIIENIVRQAGQRIEPERPLANVRLSDGSLATIALPPSSVKGPTITIRKRFKKPVDMAYLVSLGTMSKEMADFLQACVQGRLNIVICGEMRSGRTMLLNALCSCIPAEERIVTIEERAELQLHQKQVVMLEAGQPMPDSTNSVTMRDLVAHALQIRPERIIIDECRGAESADLLQAMYTGYSGSLMTIYAHNLRDCLSRLEMMWQVGEKVLPITTIRQQLVSTLDVVVHLSRLSDGTRKIINIAEVQGVDGEKVKLQSIFHYSEARSDEKSDNVCGSFQPSGFRPTFMTKFEARGIMLPDEMFVPRRVSEQSKR